MGVIIYQGIAFSLYTLLKEEMNKRKEKEKNAKKQKPGNLDILNDMKAHLVTEQLRSIQLRLDQVGKPAQRESKPKILLCCNDNL